MANIARAECYVPSKLAAKHLREVANAIEKDDKYWHRLRIEDNTREVDELRPSLHKIYGKEAAESYVANLIAIAATK